MSMLKSSECKTLIQLVINTPSVKQAVASLEHITRNQTLAISEIVYNILEGHIALSPQDKKSFARHKQLLRSLGTKTLSSKARVCLITTKDRVLVGLFRRIKAKLSTVLSKV